MPSKNIARGILLANGCSGKHNTAGKAYSHDIRLLYVDVKKICQDLLPDMLREPELLNMVYWRDRTPENFLTHLYDNGNPDNRYSIYGYDTESQDLHMLDQMVFALRRLVRPLDKRMFYGDGAPTFTYRQQLGQSRRYHPLSALPLDELIRSAVDTPLRHAALNLNLQFAPDGFEHTPFPQRSAARNPVIYRRILSLLEGASREMATEGIELGEWLLNNVQIPRGGGSVDEQIRNAMNGARTKHGLD